MAQAARQKAKVTLQELGSYEKVLKTFRSYDADRNGRMSHKELHQLMFDMNGGNWSSIESDRLLITLDKDRSGFVDINEFVAYVFQGGTASAQENAYTQVLEQFRRFDTNRNGTLDMNEFTRLMSSLKPGQWTHGHTQKVFQQVDADHSGEVDLDELVGYLFGVSGGASKRPHGQQGLLKLEFVCGPGKSEMVVREIAKKWERQFGKDLACTRKIDNTVKGITRCSANGGQVVFWDDASMLPYSDNPFENMKSMKDWVTEMSGRHIPRLLQGARIAHQNQK